MLGLVPGRHRAPRRSVPTRALAAPVVLLVAAGGAFAGLAGVSATAGSPPFEPSASPAQPSASPPSGPSASAALPPVPALPWDAYARDLDAVLAGAARARRPRIVQRTEVVQQRARPAEVARASRSRRPALPARSPAVAAPDSAVEHAQAPRPQRAVRPVDGVLTSAFGPRWGRLHAGLDFAAGAGSPVRAVAAGEVVDAGYDSGYGSFVHVRHDDDTVTTYNHLGRILLRTGPVDPGDVLGLVGSTGHSTGPHLHFEVRVDGRPVDPLPWLRGNSVAV